MEPASHTFEIIPVAYYPGESSVSDLLEQIPLQSTFNFRLRFQNYSGLLALSSFDDNDNFNNDSNNKQKVCRRVEGRTRKSTATTSLSSSSSSFCHQLAQSKPVPMKYSCEYHHLKQQEKKERSNRDKDANDDESDCIMPLVAILPDNHRHASNGPALLSTCTPTMAEVTERLARGLLNEPKVRRRLRFLQRVVQSSSSSTVQDDDNH
jgi:hypothetical protein